jgi:hypothetical protein
MTQANSEQRLEQVEESIDIIEHSVTAIQKRLDVNFEHIATQIGQMDHKIKTIADRNAKDYGHLFKRMDALDTPQKPDRSAIYTALAAAQVEINNAVTKTKNEYTNKDYADLASVLDAVRPHLAANGIALFQTTEDTSSSVLGIRTVLAHGESGQTIQDVITMSPPKVDPQGIGSCRTYMRRYAILALCGIAGAKDDDAEKTKAKLEPSEVEKILYHADELFGGEHADDAVELMLKNVFGSSDAKVIGDIPAGELNVAISALDRLKAKRDKQIDAAKKLDKAAAKAAKEA